MKASERFKLFHQVHYCASQAALESGRDREYRALTATIEENEKDHRAFGRRLVGASATRGRFTIGQSCDLFVVKTLAYAYGKNGHGWERQIPSLVGLRDDFVRAAILVADPTFRASFEKHMKDSIERGRIANVGASSIHRILQRIDELADYSALANGAVK